MSSPIARNWARMADLSRINPRNKLQDAEYNYRVAVQNQYSATGKMDPDFIEPKEGY